MRFFGNIYYYVFSVRVESLSIVIISDCNIYTYVYFCFVITKSYSGFTHAEILDYKNSLRNQFDYNRDKVKW